MMGERGSFADSGAAPMAPPDEGEPGLMQSR